MICACMRIQKMFNASDVFLHSVELSGYYLFEKEFLTIQFVFDCTVSNQLVRKMYWKTVYVVGWIFSTFGKFDLHNYVCI